MVTGAGMELPRRVADWPLDARYEMQERIAIMIECGGCEFAAADEAEREVRERWRSLAIPVDRIDY